MVVVELRAPVYDEEAGTVIWRPRAIVSVQDGELQIMGEETLFGDETMTVIDLATGRQLSRADNPEGWARNLPYAYRSGDLVAVVVIDSDPPEPSPRPDDPRALPVIGASQPRVRRDSPAAKA